MKRRKEKGDFQEKRDFLRVRNFLRKSVAILIVILLFAQMTACMKKDSTTSESKQSSMDDSGDVESSYSMTTQSVSKSETASAETPAQSFDGSLADTIAVGEEPIDINTEEYDAVTENVFQSVAKYPLSTFSADVDTASYSNVRRLLMAGSYVEPGAVRIEEMINYFSYDYNEPKEGEPFGVTMEMSDCPWNADNKLLMLGLKTEDLDVSMAPHSNLVFLLDVSGSMYDEDKLPLVQKAFNLLTDNLTENDRISIVTYAGSDSVVLEGVSGDQKERIMEAVNALEASGSTAGSAGIKTAYQIAEKYFIKGGNNRILLATDGDLNVGITSTNELTALITKEKESGVYLSVLGFGTGNLKDNKMEALADNGNGNYSYIDSLKEAKKVLVEEMGSTLVTVAEDVKFQIEFNPENVLAYRLIGYENRVMEAEDFNDDTKDAGEIGAGHTLTVLYEIVPVNTDKEVAMPDLKYQKDDTEDSSSEESSPSDSQAASEEATAKDDLLQELTESQEAQSSEQIDLEKIKETEMEKAENLSNEYATLSIRYKEPGTTTSSLLTYEITKQEETVTPSSDFKFAAAVAEFGMRLRGSAYIGDITYLDILTQLSGDSYEDDEYKQEFLSLVLRADSLIE